MHADMHSERIFPLSLFVSVSILIIAFLYVHLHLTKQKTILHKYAENEIVTLIFDFENGNNDLRSTVSNICESGLHKVVVLSDNFIYPEIDFSPLPSKCSVEVIENRRSPFSTSMQLNVASRIDSRYLLVVPDSTRILSIAEIRNSTQLIDLLLSRSQRDGLLFPILLKSADVPNITCNTFVFDVRRWTLQYFATKVAGRFGCDYDNKYDFVLLIKTHSFFKLNRPFSRPFAKSFAIQAYLANLSIELMYEPKIFVQEINLFHTERLQAKRNEMQKYRLAQFYQDMGIKKVIYADPHFTEWRGCQRQTKRCFGTIVNDTPDYLTLKRWLPPCCLRNLETTGRYVMQLLDKFGVRYWLEGGSLLGAARNGRIIEWDFDIDIGVYREDSRKLMILHKLLDAESGSQIEDGQSFLWEKAIEGDFIKVHYSKANRVHVDIFPFEPINGTMTKNTWFASHRQDMPFAEHYLKPLSRIKFIGMEASAPNDVVGFLELKFGKGVIENPRYPSGKLVNDDDDDLDLNFEKENKFV